MQFYKYLKKMIYFEKERQKKSVNLIASENLIDIKNLYIQSNIFCNKYAEGYSGNRYYSGCRFVDIVEQTAINELKKLFKAKYANVQPHSGSQANQSVYMALCKPCDVILGLDLYSGGHLSHGFKSNYSGYYYKSFFYDVNKFGHIDYDAIYDLALKVKPKILIAGASAYSRLINWKTFKFIANKIGAYLVADISHISGLIAAGLHPSPIDYADVVTSTVHKTLRGPRGAFILTNNYFLYCKINKAVFPGIQGGPFVNIILAKALAFFNASKIEFKVYQKNVLRNLRIFVKIFKKYKVQIISGGSDTHLLLIDLRSVFKTGKEAEMLLNKFNIFVNKNFIPSDKYKYKNRSCSGIRIGTPFITSRKFLEKDIIYISKIICKILRNEIKSKNIKTKIKNISNKYLIDLL